MINPLKIKIQVALLLVSVGLLTSSCKIVGTLYPLSQNENDFIFKKEIIGKWGDPKDPAGYYKLDTVPGYGGKLYRTVVTENKDGNIIDSNWFYARFINVNGWYFLDNWVNVTDILPAKEKDYSDFLISKHFLFRLSFTNPDTIEMTAPDPDELIKLIDQKKILLHYSQLKEDDYLILDKSKELQKGLIESKKYPLLYKDKITLVRLK
ncbi:MAG TPA: hypothetical protein VIV35_04945 [Chitinophagaceae bacterium]